LKDKSLYIGFTKNLKQRLTNHFYGNSKSTAPRRPFKLIFCECFLLSKKDTQRREKYFKTTKGKRTICALSLRPHYIFIIIFLSTIVNIFGDVQAHTEP